MNHIYRVIFNQETGTFQAVSEIVKTTRKSHSSKGGHLPKILLTPLSVAVTLLSSQAFASPTGGQVTTGTATINQAGSITNINQSSQNAAINWQSFNVGKNETVNFNQPNAQSVTLNRVIGNERSVIDGAMNASGKVFISNTNGMLIGKDAKINVGSLVATTANISDDDLMNGRYQFTGEGAGNIENLGHISVPKGGVVALVAPIVKNGGTITAHEGNVLLASAESFSITLPDNANFAYTLDKGTLQGLVDNGGAIFADAGRVVLTAKGVDAVKKSLIKHSGNIEANTVQNKNGVIELLGDLDNSALNVSGSLKAEAKESGDGGFIETSASQVRIEDSAVISTKSETGQTGTWLIDPKDFTVAPSGGDITGAKVSEGLQSNNITLKSRDGAKEGKGDVIINDEISWDKNTLTLNAENDIHINKTMNGSGTAKLALEYGQGKSDGGESDYYLDKNTPLKDRTVKVNLPEGKNFSTKKGSNGQIVEFDVIHQMPNIEKDNQGNWRGYTNSQRIALGSDIDISHTKNHTGFGGWEVTRADDKNLVGNPDFRLHGLGHQIDGLYLNVQAVGDPRIGLIQNFAPSSSSNDTEKRIRDLGVTNVDISANGGFRVNTGAIAGLGGNIADSYATGKIYSNSRISPIGGLLGSGSHIVNSYADVDIQAINDGAMVGGLGGNVEVIEKSYATGNLTIEGKDSRVGGLIGAGRVVAESYATGNVTANQNDAKAGGLIGRGGEINNSYATGNVTSQGYAGGLVGEGHSIINSYANNTVAGAVAQGGLVGRYEQHARSKSENSFFNTDKNDNSLSAIGGYQNTGSENRVNNLTGKTNSQLTDSNTFINWDFDKVWYINAGEMPKLHAHKKGTVVITPKTDLAINANHLNKVYDGKAVENEEQLREIAKKNGFDDIATITGLKTGDSLSSLGTLSYDGTWKNAKDANTYSIIPTGLTGGQDYEIKYGAGSLTIDKRPAIITGTKIYDGTNTISDSELRLNNIVVNDDVALKANTTGKIADKNVGMHSITDPDTLAIIGTNAHNYFTHTQTVQVKPKTLNISVSKDFDDNATFNKGFTATNIIAGDTVNVAGTATVSDKKAGTYNRFVSANLTSDNNNYEYVQGTSAVNATITPTPTPVVPTPTLVTPVPVPVPTPTPTPIVPTPTPITPVPVAPTPVPTPTPVTPTPTPVVPTPTLVTPVPVPVPTPTPTPIVPTPTPITPVPVAPTPVPTPTPVVPTLTPTPSPVMPTPILVTPTPPTNTNIGEEKPNLTGKFKDNYDAIVGGIYRLGETIGNLNEGIDNQIYGSLIDPSRCSALDMNVFCNKDVNIAFDGMRNYDRSTQLIIANAGYDKFDKGVKKITNDFFDFNDPNASPYKITKDIFNTINAESIADEIANQYTSSIPDDITFSDTMDFDLKTYLRSIIKTKEMISIINKTNENGLDNKLANIYLDVNTSQGELIQQDIHKSNNAATKANSNRPLELFGRDGLDILKKNGYQLADTLNFAGVSAKYAFEAAVPSKKLLKVVGEIKDTHYALSTSATVLENTKNFVAAYEKFTPVMQAFDKLSKGQSLSDSDMQNITELSSAVSKIGQIAIGDKNTFLKNIAEDVDKVATVDGFARNLLSIQNNAEAMNLITDIPSQYLNDVEKENLQSILALNVARQSFDVMLTLGNTLFKDSEIISVLSDGMSLADIFINTHKRNVADTYIRVYNQSEYMQPHLKEQAIHKGRSLAMLVLEAGKSEK